MPHGGAVDASSLWDSVIPVLQVIGVDILLACDNAIAMAMACRTLPRGQRALGLVIGVGIAVVMRVLYATGISFLLALPVLRLAGALLLFWIAVKLLMPSDEPEGEVASGGNLWSAVRTVVLADLVMSLDNVVAIAAVADGNIWAIAYGLSVSIPLIVASATVIMALLIRFPVIVWIGAALLGRVAGELIHTELLLAQHVNAAGAWFGLSATATGHVLAVSGAVLVVAVAWILMARRRGAAESPA